MQENIEKLMDQAYEGFMIFTDLTQSGNIDLLFEVAKDEEKFRKIMLFACTMYQEVLRLLYFIGKCMDMHESMQDQVVLTLASHVIDKAMQNLDEAERFHVLMYLLTLAQIDPIPERMKRLHEISNFS